MNPGDYEELLRSVPSWPSILTTVGCVVVFGLVLRILSRRK